MRKTLVTLLFVTIVTALTAAQQFQPAAYYRATGSGGYVGGSVAADFNHDGWADLAVIDTNANTGFVFMNQKNGTFGQGLLFRLPSATIGIAAGDLNTDNKIDLVTISTYDGAPGVLQIFLGNADGTFTQGNHYLVGSAPTRVVVADLNGDGHNDVAVVNWQGGGVMIFLGDGHGNLTAAGRYRGARNPLAMAVGDVNGDGHPDIVVAGITGTLGVLLNQGDGTFINGSSAAISTSPLDLTLVDLNRDGKLDVVVSQNPMNVLLNNGDGTFGAATSYASDSDPRGLTTADFNHDGNPDIALITLNSGIDLYYGNGDGTLQAAINIGLQAQADNSGAVADFDKDGAPDLAVNTGESRVAVLLNSQ